MNESAVSARDQRKRETAQALTDAGRRLTVEHGFAGFTVEQLCAEAGVSRRTFFNYFESKENAVFGVTAVDPRQAALERSFVGADGDLLDDFIRLTVDRFALMNPPDDAPAMLAVIEREPRLLRAAFGQLAKNERRDVDLIRERAGESADAALQAEVMVHTVGALVRLSMDQLLHDHSTEPFGDLIDRRLDAARTVFAQRAD